MSLHETPMTRRYWQRVGGTLIEEFLLVPPAPGTGTRRADAVIILGSPTCQAKSLEVSLSGKDVIVVQTKASRLGMSVLGQALFSRMLIEDRFSPRSVRSVAICAADAAVLHPLAERMGIEVVVDTTERPP